MKTTLSEDLLASVRLHEGFRDRPYKDTVGKLTIGYGWNIDDTPLCREAAEVQMVHKLLECEQALIKRLEFYNNLTQARKDVLIEMCFNLGVEGFFGFKNTIRLMRESKHENAAVQMLKSTWAKQVGQRARTLAAKYAKG